MGRGQEPDVSKEAANTKPEQVREKVQGPAFKPSMSCEKRKARGLGQSHMANMQLHWLLEENKEISSLILSTLLSFLKTTHLLVNMFHSLANVTCHAFSLTWRGDGQGAFGSVTAFFSLLLVPWTTIGSTPIFCQAGGLKDGGSCFVYMYRYKCMYRYMDMGVYIVLIHFFNLIITYLGPNTAVYSMKLLPEVSQNHSSSQTF